MDIITWITGITATAKLIEAWKKARKAGVELDQTLEEIHSNQEAYSSEVEVDLVISEELLKAFIKDIEKANQRFYECINDPRYTPAQIDQEQEIATRSICTHLGKIAEFNNGILPDTKLIKMSESFQCGV